MTDTWDPRQYDRFQREREQPFYDLLSLVRRVPAMRVVDLGCGTGKLTKVLHERLEALDTLGIDSSPRMLESAPTDRQGLRFETGSIESFPGARGPLDLIYSNAAYHWVDDHEALLARLAAALSPRGQLAFQIPAQHESASHRIADALSREEPFRSAFGGWERSQPVLAPERYAALLYGLGFNDPVVRVIVYPHVLPDPDAVVEWMKGTLLTEYARHLPATMYDQFVDAYRSRLLPQLGDARPFFFPFKRILCWGQRSGHA